MVKILEKYQSKSVTPVDKYECTLSEELIKLAEKKLGETPEIRDKCLHEFREWIWNNPRIEKCRMDSKYLLRFLRCHNFSLRHAKEGFERSLILREGLYGQDWFTNLDLNRPNVQEFLNDGLQIVLPYKAKTGETVLIGRCRACDPSLDNAGNAALSLSTMIMEAIFEEEENQIRGFKVIFDYSGVHLSHYFMFSFSTWFKILKQLERTFGAKLKGVCIMGLSAPLRFAYKIAQSHIKERFHKIMTCPTGPEEIDFIDRKYLPIEYGGEYTIDELMEPIKTKLEMYSDLFKKYGEMKINRKYYKDSVLKCDVSTLKHSLENRQAKLLKEYPEENENDD